MNRKCCTRVTKLSAENAAVRILEVENVGQTEWEDVCIECERYSRDNQRTQSKKYRTN